MLRAQSTRAGYRGYDRLDNTKSSGNDLDDAQLMRVVSVPAGVYDIGFSNMVKGTELPLKGTKTQQQDKSAKKAAETHPLFGMFVLGGRLRKKKITARPDISRYVEYLKEGGL